jgi:hypothetical protein
MLRGGERWSIDDKLERSFANAHDPVVEPGRNSHHHTTAKCCPMLGGNLTIRLNVMRWRGNIPE